MTYTIQNYTLKKESEVYYHGGYDRRHKTELHFVRGVLHHVSIDSSALSHVETRGVHRVGY